MLFLLFTPGLEWDRDFIKSVPDHGSEPQKFHHVRYPEIPDLIHIAQSRNICENHFNH